MSTAPVESPGLSPARDAPQRHGAPVGHTAYQIDPATSRVEFTIRKRLFFVTHLLVTGRFSDVQGAISIDERTLTNSHATVTIGAASVDTRMGKRDKHLRQADFFDVEQHPTLTFTSRRIKALDEAAGRYRVTGDLTVRGVTREVVLDTYYTSTRGEGSARRIILTLTGALNRRDFGMVWNKSIINVADDLTVTLRIEATTA